MKPQKITWTVLVGATVALIAYDIVAASLWGDSATESEVLLGVGHRHPIIPFALGVLMGHFFASQPGEKPWRDVVVPSVN